MVTVNRRSPCIDLRRSRSYSNSIIDVEQERSKCIQGRTCTTTLAFLPDTSTSQQLNNMDKDYDPEQGLPNPDSQEVKDTGNVIGGLKASLSNDNNSEEAKQADRQRLEEMEAQGKQGFSTES